MVVISDVHCVGGVYTDPSWKIKLTILKALTAK